MGEANTAIMLSSGQGGLINWILAEAIKTTKEHNNLRVSIQGNTLKEGLIILSFSLCYYGINTTFTLFR